MIVSLRGILVDKGTDGAVIEVAGVGHGVLVSTATLGRLPALGEEVRLLIVESVAMYGGGVTLYGFLTPEEKQIFNVLRDNVPGAGAKKALDLLDKAGRSLPDFRRAIIDRDTHVLVSLFGFTAKTAEKMVSALQGKLDHVPLSETGVGRAPTPAQTLDEAVAGLVQLGYRESTARAAAQSARQRGAHATEEIIRESLKHLSGRD